MFTQRQKIAPESQPIQKRKDQRIPSRPPERDGPLLLDQCKDFPGLAERLPNQPCQPAFPFHGKRIEASPHHPDGRGRQGRQKDGGFDPFQPGVAQDRLPVKGEERKVEDQQGQKTVDAIQKDGGERGRVPARVTGAQAQEAVAVPAHGGGQEIVPEKAEQRQPEKKPHPFLNLKIGQHRLPAKTGQRHAEPEKQEGRDQPGPVEANRQGE